ncbi:hypothetical protein [Ensifer adhaerens]|uniref:hypothetical protein n=1 Tax=Ensifer adhaerens TaxID=106592 RepID=UPI001568BEF9|nr:hypothetical protein [Ensifer adhaerens]
MLVREQTEIPIAGSKPVEHEAAGGVVMIGKCTQLGNQGHGHRWSLANAGEREADQDGGMVAAVIGVTDASRLKVRDSRQPAMTARRRDGIGRDRFTSEGGHRRAVCIDGHEDLLAGAHWHPAFSEWKDGKPAARLMARPRSVPSDD